MAARMLFEIKPTSEMTFKLHDKRIGYLGGILIDMDNKNMLGIPKIQLSVVLEQNAFENEATLNKVVAIAHKTGIIKITILEE